MARIAAYIASFFTSTFGLFAAWFGSKAALATTIVTVTAAMTLTLYIVIKALLQHVIMLVPYEPFVMGFFACWPSNAETCIAACFGADIAVFIYRYKIGLIESLAK